MIKTNIKPSECSCPKCKNMCKTTPCLGTPQDIEKLIEAGYASKLSLSVYATGMLMGAMDRTINMIQPRFDEVKGSCVFLDDKGLCELHNIGLKPTEGKLASCKPEVVSSFKDTINFKVAITWLPK